MIGFIGGGNMAEPLIKGMTEKGMKDIMVSEPREERRKELQQLYGTKTDGIQQRSCYCLRYHYPCGEASEYGRCPRGDSR